MPEIESETETETEIQATIDEFRRIDEDPEPDDADALEGDVALDEELGGADPGQCEAIAEYSGERCQRLSLSALPYCPFHLSDLEQIDSPRD